jgi:PAS domain S-box-containing protein
MLGYAREELIELTFQDITHPEDLDADLAQAQRLFAGEIRSYSLEKRYRRKDGSVVWGMLTGSVVRDAGGTVEYAIAVVRDITDRKAVEAQRAQSERDYRTLFEASHDAILLMDMTGTIVNVNQRAAQLYGYSREELIGSPIGLLSRNVERGRAHAERAIAGAPETRFETTHARKDGRVVELEANSVVVRYGGRDVVLTSYHDVTEEKRLLRALEANERRFRALVEHGYDMIAILDPQRRIRFASGSTMQTLGYAPDELTGRTLGESVHPEDLPRLAELYASVIDSPHARPSLVCRLRAKNGEWRWCEGGAVNLLHVEGVEGIVVIARDVTEHRELAARLEQARRVESLGRVAANVAHEFNNVLMAIQPLAQILERKPQDAERVLRAASQILASVKRGGVIASEILRFANPRAPLRQHVEVAPWLATAVEELRPVAGSRVALSVTADDSLAVSADPIQLHQLLANLVLNARDAMPIGGAIHLRAQRDGRYAAIAVRDSGTGIAPEIRARLFEPLFTTKRNGTGLGLALCQQIVTAHGGTIEVHSPAEGGTEILVKLPAA